MSTDSFIYSKAWNRMGWVLFVLNLVSAGFNFMACFLTGQWYRIFFGLFNTVAAVVVYQCVIKVRRTR